MDRTAVFVDAGYLFAAGSQLLVNERLVRGELHLDHAAILRRLEQIVAEASGLPMLRVYWYDGTSGVPTPQQLALAYQPGVKLRLGFVNQHGQQRGVDSLIITDLIQLARNRAMADAVLLTGDEDIRVGVQQAQEIGVRVHLVGIAPVRENQSSLLRQEADTLIELSLADVQAFLKPLVAEGPRAAPPEAEERAAPADLAAVAQRVAGSLAAEEIEAVLLESSGVSVPAVLDRRLLLEGSRALGAPLTPDMKRQVRAAFLAACRGKAAT
jgi:uncharacterized LabA/DUF88 family protein